MDTSAQQAQPIPLFYGVIDIGLTVQDLTSGFDYVITCIQVGNGGDAAAFLTVADESDVTIFQVPIAGNTGGDNFPSTTLNVDMPIGPRTELRLTATGNGIGVFIGGYALYPPSALHV